ncbi:MAG: 4-hydroxy-3-methylbut-2-enyl diphosphate reductase [Clostridia bacterium]|nr:4-hydroxy-3-methylbut-2-enyl diphosphate reductase [Clostridia bacterium]
MEVKIGKTSGFCYGVNNAVKRAEEEIEKTKETVYCLGELVHNKEVTKKLEKKGLKFIDDINEAEGKTIIRAHGVQKEVYETAQKKRIELVDLTCPSVLKIHNIAQEYSQKRYYIFLIGEPEHPEVIGTYSFCGENSTIISNIEEVQKAIRDLKKTEIKELLIISQTTYNLKKYTNIIKQINEQIGKDVKIEEKCTICLATEQRQKETEEISKEVGLMIIIGGRKSSNTNKLYDISCKNCKNAIFVENKNDLELEKGNISKFDKIGIMAGASTPRESIDEIVKYLDKEKELLKI